MPRERPAYVVASRWLSTWNRQKVSVSTYIRLEEETYIHPNPILILCRPCCESTDSSTSPMPWGAPISFPSIGLIASSASIPGSVLQAITMAGE